MSVGVFPMFNAVLTVSVQKIAYVAYMPFVPCSIAGMPNMNEQSMK